MPRTISPGVLWRKLFPMESLGQWKLMWYARGRKVTFEEQNELEGILVQAFANDDYTHLRFQDTTGADGTVVLTMPDAEYYCRGSHQNYELKNMGKKTVAGDDKTVEFTMVPKEAEAITLTGDTGLVTDNETIEAVYEAELDEALIGVPVVFTTDFDEADIDDVDAGDVADFTDGDGVEVLTNTEGKAQLTVTFAAGVAQKSENITATISDDDDFVAAGGASDDFSVSVNTAEKVADTVVLTGEEAVRADSETKSELYIAATVDVPWPGIPVLFTTAFTTDHIEAVFADGEQQDVSDLVGAGLTVETDSVGHAEIFVTFKADVDEEATITAAIDDDHELVSSSDDSVLTVNVNTEAKIATTVTLTGDESITSDDEPEDGTYTAALDIAWAGIPILFTTDFLEGDIDAVSEGTVEEFTNGGVEVLSDSSGEAELVVTFAADVEKETDITAAINEEHDNIGANDDDSVTVDVDTTSNT